MSTRVLGLAFIATVVLAPVLTAGQSSPAPAANSSRAAATSAPAPRTPWGDPDLQGTWDYRSITPLERPRQFGDREFLTDAEVKEMEARAAKRMDEPPPDDGPANLVHPQYWTDPGRKVTESRRTSLIVDPPDGRLPPTTAEAQARVAAGPRAGGAGGRAGGRADSWLDRTPLERCITWGMPTNILPGLYNNNIQIVQAPNYVAIVHEMVHDARVIPLDGRSHFDEPQWLGTSRGHFEGDTLVVVTKGFSTKTAYRGSTTNLTLTERYRRLDANTIDFRITVEDPQTWTRPWTAAFQMRPSEGDMYEYACHEGNYGLRNMLEVARDEEKAAAAAAAGGKK
jgi:hypothetical protein